MAKAKTKAAPEAAMTARIDLMAEAFDGLTAEDREVIRRTLGVTGRLKVGAPALDHVERTIAGRSIRFPTIESARAAILWRLLAYYLSPSAKDQGAPDGLSRHLDLPPADKAAELACLESLARRVLTTIPRKHWHAFNYRASLGWTDPTGPVLH